MAEHEIHPLTICRDRYEGVYSGGKYVAWKCYPWEIPVDPYSDDVTCIEFWEKMKLCELLYATGNTPTEAVEKLAEKLLRRD